MKITRDQYPKLYQASWSAQQKALFQTALFIYNERKALERALSQEEDLASLRHRLEDLNQFQKRFIDYAMTEVNEPLYACFAERGLNSSARPHYQYFTRMDNVWGGSRKYLNHSFFSRCLTSEKEMEKAWIHEFYSKEKLYENRYMVVGSGLAMIGILGFLGVIMMFFLLPAQLLNVFAIGLVFSVPIWCSLIMGPIYAHSYGPCLFTTTLDLTEPIVARERLESICLMGNEDVPPTGDVLQIFP